MAVQLRDCVTLRQVRPSWLPSRRPVAAQKRGSCHPEASEQVRGEVVSSPPCLPHLSLALTIEAGFLCLSCTAPA